MGWKESLTPKDTKEVKPGLFIQRWRGGWRQVNPACWNGKVNYRNLVFGGSIFKLLIVFAILLLLSYSYYTTTRGCEEFQSDPCKYLPNITSYCMDIENRDAGLTTFSVSDNGNKTHYNPLQSYP